MKIGIIGYGYWGPNLVRNFNSHPEGEVKYIVEKNSEAIKKARKMYPSITVTSEYSEVLNDAEIDAVAIATPVYTHYNLADQALENNKHVMLEKPMCSTREEAEKLIEKAEEKGLVLMVDHTYLYTGAVRKMKELVESGEVGDIKYIDSTRINLGLFQRDVNVLWDLAPHDISICRYLMDEYPSAVQAVGTAHTESGLENIAYLTLHYPQNKIAHFNCSWVSPVKIRHMLIGGDRKMIVFNDLEVTEKIRIYDKGYTVLPTEQRDEVLVDYRIGDIQIPKVPQSEALAGVANDFIRSIKEGTAPISDYRSGLEVVSILEAAQKSIKNRGSIIEL